MAEPLQEEKKQIFDVNEGVYKIRDIKLAEFGRKEIELAEIEMPGLMACRKEMCYTQPLKGAKIAGSLHMNISTAVLIETLHALGAELQWCSSNIFSTQDHATAAIAAAKTCAVFAWKGETLEEYWDCHLAALTWPNDDGPNLIVDDGGDATLMIHEGVKWEKRFESDGSKPEPEKESDADFKHVLRIIRESLETDPKKWHKIASKIAGVSEQTTCGVNRLYHMTKQNELLFPAISVNDSVTKSKFDNTYGCRQSLLDGIMRAIDIMFAGKKVVICGYGDVGKGCVEALRHQGAIVMITEIDPICALQACMEGIAVVQLNDVISDADIFVTATGNKDIIMVDQLAKMKNNAIVANIGHSDNEIDMEGLRKYKAIKRVNIKPQVDRWIFPDGKTITILAEGRLVNLGCAQGHPSFVLSCSFTNQTLAQIELWENRNSDKYKNSVCRLPKILDEKVARLHLKRLGAKLTQLSKEQAEYISVNVEGPYKAEHYRY